MRRAWLAALVLALAPAAAGCFEPATNDWAVEATQLDALRATGATGAGIRVAILDSGIDLAHPSLQHLQGAPASAGRLLAYVDFLGTQQGAQDVGGHGTFVAGLLAARPPDGLASVTQSSSAVLGLAPDVHLLVGRVCEVDHCSLLALSHAIEWAIQQDADVISLSLGHPQAEVDTYNLFGERVRMALAKADERGILVVAAAGNDAGPIRFPANQASVLAVGAMGRDGHVRPSTAHGDDGRKPDLVAPGEGIVGPQRGGGRVSVHGTSAAVPFVVAAAALLMDAQHDPQDSEDLAALREALRASAAPLPGQRHPHDPWAGNGLLQGSAALQHYAALLQGPGAPPHGLHGRA